MKFSLVCVLTRSSNKVFCQTFLYTLFILLFLISGCSSHPKGPPGKGIMSQDRFVDLLVDIHYLEAVYSVTASITSPRRDVFKDTLDFYHGVFERHGATRDEFKKSMNYYSYDPNLFEKLYTRVIDEINIKISEVDMKELELSEASLAEQVNDSGPGNLWNLVDNWSFPGPDTNKMISFKIPARGPGIYTFTAQIRLDREDVAENPRVSLWFWYDDGTEYGHRENFIPFSMDKDGRVRQVRVARELTNPDVTHIKGHVLNLSNPEDLGERHARVRNIRLNFSESPDPAPH